MLGWIKENSRKDHIRNVTIRTDKILSLFGDLPRRDGDNVACPVIAIQMEGPLLITEVIGPIEI